MGNILRNLSPQSGLIPEKGYQQWEQSFGAYRHNELFEVIKSTDHSAACRLLSHRSGIILMPPNKSGLFAYIRKTALFFMKTGLSLFLACISTLLFAQQAIIEPDNPSPRVGDKISLSILLLNSPSADPAADAEKRTATGSLKLSQTLLDTGLVNIGPFSFTLNNQSYEPTAIS